MRNKYFLITLIIFLYCLPACKLNDNTVFEDEYNSALAIDLLQPTIAQTAFNQSAIAGRSASVIMQYLQEADASITFYKQYNFGDTFFSSVWSSGFYGGSLVSANQMKQLATEENETALLSISLILLAHEYNRLTNMFGDIPFSEALQGADNNTPKYDPQQDIYVGIIEMLNEAIEFIGNQTINNTISNDDLIYQGDMQRWKKLAIGLKARFLLNQRNQNGGNDSEILMLIDNSFDNRNEQADFNFDAAFNNPQFTFATERPSTLVSGDFFVNLLLSTQDPRTSSYTIQDGNDWNYFGSSDFKWFERMAVIPILSYTELMFMRAEILYHSGANQNEIGASLEEAITSSMMDNNIDLNDNTMLFISSTSDLSGLDSELILQRIMEQSYISYYGFNHLQTWNNYRRTGYPAISSTATNINEQNPSNVVPRRFPYPKSEFDYNENNIQEALARQNGALLDSDIWLFE
jgi:hypothetical protein